MTPSPTLASILSEFKGFDPKAVPVETAQAAIARCVQPLDCIEQVALRDAWRRVLARDLLSPIDVPAHDNSAMDGWAFAHADLSPHGESRLRVVGEAFAGSPFTGRVLKGQAVRIMTGAVMPEGCDTVVPQELAQTHDGHVLVPPGQTPGQHRRLRGEDLARNKPALRAGRIIGAADLGLIASLGLAEVPVQRRLRVAFFFNRRRTAVDWRAAGGGQRLRQQPLYALGTAEQSRRRPDRHGRGAGFTRRT